MESLKDWFEKTVRSNIRVLALGGSDPGGGAGIQQDCRTITVLGAYGTSIPTAITVQNTLGCEDWVPVDPELLERQIINCTGDISFHAIKIGMLGTLEIVKAIETAFNTVTPPPVVVLDPVLRSKNNRPLLDERATGEIITRLAPFVSLITPNIPEAKTLLGIGQDEDRSQEELAMALLERLPQKENTATAVIVKGGHGENQHVVVDVLADRAGTVAVRGKRIKTPHTHGTGCAYSSCIATLLGGGLDIRSAMKISREFMETSLLAGSGLGSGIGPVNTLAVYRQLVEREHVVEALKNACALLEEHPGAGCLAPEIQINLGYALRHARSKEHVAAFPGRIVRIKERLARIKDPEFGASSHVANIILTAMGFDEKIRSAMDIRMDKNFLQKAHNMGMSVAFFSRKEEPEDVKEREGSSLVWGVKKAIEGCGGRVPDLVWDDGDIGKEPAIRILGENPVEVVKKALSLI